MATKPEWATVRPESGQGGAEVDVIVGARTDDGEYTSIRQGTLTVKTSSGLSKQVSISQQPTGSYTVRMGSLAMTNNTGSSMNNPNLDVYFETSVGTRVDIVHYKSYQEYSNGQIWGESELRSYEYMWKPQWPSSFNITGLFLSTNSGFNASVRVEVNTETRTVTMTGGQGTASLSYYLSKGSFVSVIIQGSCTR